MTHDVIQQLEAYGAYADAVAPAISTEELDLRSAERMPPLTPQRRAFPNWVVAVGAAIAVFVLIGGVAWLLGGGEPDVADEPAATTTTTPASTTTLAQTTTTPPPITTTVPAVPSALASVTAAARTEGIAFDFAQHDLCEWFTTDEILDIVAQAYTAKGIDYPIPTVLVAEGERIRSDRPGCDWTVPGTPGGWGRPDFTVMFRDDSDVRLYTDTGRDGPTILETQKQEIASGAFYDEIYGVDAYVGDALSAGGVVQVGGWSPGFYFYVESQDRSIDFRHDFAASVQQDPELCRNECEDYTVEALIVETMLERMNWLLSATD